MQPKQWQQLQILKYTGYSLANQMFSWQYVERIGEIMISADLQAYFTVYFVSGNTLEYRYDKYILTPEYPITKGRFFTSTTPVLRQYYFQNPPANLLELAEIRRQAVTAFQNFRSKFLRKGL